MLLLQVLGLRRGNLRPTIRSRALARIMAVCHVVVVGRSRSRGLLLVVISLAWARRWLAMHAGGGRHCVRPSLVKHWRDRGRCHGLGPARRGGSAKDVRERGISLVVSILIGIAALALLARRSPRVILIVGHACCEGQA